MPIETSRRAGVGRPAIVRLPQGQEPETFAEQVRRGLASKPRTLPCQFFYDEAGSRLFERICDLPEYYLTRTEDAILRDHAPAMVAAFDRPPTLVELGSGSSTKTRRLIEASLEAYHRLRYVPIDVSATILEESARELTLDYPGLRVTGYAADYRVALASPRLRSRSPKLIAFLGSSLGNYEVREAVSLLESIGLAMGPDDRLLLGTDLAKDRARLEAAYDDAEGVTGLFNRNILARINRELGGDFDVDRFEHRARYREDLLRVEMHLVSLGDQVVEIPGVGLAIAFGDGESIHTENSHKYTESTLRDLATRSGFVEESAWTDAEGLFRVQKWRLSAD